MKHLIIFAFLFCLLRTVQGQTRDEMYKNPDIMNMMWITIPAQNQFGDEHIERIRFTIDSDTISTVAIHPKHDTEYIKKNFLAGVFSQRFFFYDLGFEGDRLVFKKKYPHIHLSALPSAKVTNRYGKEDTSRKYTIEGVHLYLDSTIYHYAHGYQPDHTKSLYGMPAKYVGDLQEVEERIAREMASAAAQTPIDSTLVYGAVITRYPSESEIMPAKEKFELENLLYGKPSAFSKIVEKTLLAKETNFDENGQPKWDFAILGTSGRPIDTRIKIYVHLNTDGSITMKLPRMLGNFTGD